MRLCKQCTPPPKKTPHTPKNHTHIKTNFPPPPSPQYIKSKNIKAGTHTKKRENDPLACTPSCDVIVTSVGRRVCLCVRQLFGVIVPEKKEKRGRGGVLSILNRPSRPAADGTRWYYYLLGWCKTLRHRWATLRPEQNVYIFVLIHI